MKNYLLLIALVLLATASSAQWRTCYQGSNMDNRMTGVSFYTPSTGYIATTDWIGYTTDSGKTVNKRYVSIGNVNYGSYSVNLTFGFTIEGVKAFSADTVLVYGDYGFEPSILYSTNGGATWKIVYHKNIRLNAMYLANTMADMVFPTNGNTGFAVQGDEIVRTLDRGKTWSTTVIQNDQRLFKLVFATGSIGYAAGPGRILRTTNGGSSWSTLGNAPYSDITAISASGSQWLFVSAYGNSLYSNNQGNSFTQANSTAGVMNAADLHYINDSTGYASGGGYSILQTRNRGKSWELMQGTGFSYLGYGYSRLFFYNSTQAWICGENEYLAITTNGGGISLPRALFDHNDANSCTTNSVQLLNQSHYGYTYRWLKNGVQFATTYDASYTVNGSPDQIQLIVTKGTLSDTMTKTIVAPSSSPLVLNTRPVKDTVCSNSYVEFEVLNSRTDVQYQAGRSCCGYSSPVWGNGGTLIVSAWANSDEDSTSNFIIYAYHNGACGVQTAQQSHPVRVINTFPVTVALSDTICAQKPFTITITDSRPGYLYWTDNLAKIGGNGSAIQLPTTASLAASTYSLDFNNLLVRYTFNVYTKHERFGCGSSFPRTTVNMIGRNSIAGFVTNSHEVFTGDTLKFTDISKQAFSYYWNFSNGSSATNSPERLPNNIFYTQPGKQLLQQKTTTKEGCVDSANRYIEVFNGPVVNESPVCVSVPGQQGLDSIRRRNYFISRSFYEDEYGNRIVAGGYTSMLSPNQFYPRGYEGWFAARYNKHGVQQWYLQQAPGDDYFTYNANSHIIIEHVIGDSRGNTYMLGHSLNRSSIKDSVNTFPLQKAGGFLVKLNAAGRIQWVRTLYNKDITGLNISQDYSGGSLLRGANDDIYVVTHKYAGSSLYNFMSGTAIASTGSESKTGIILHYDTSGNIIRKKMFPITYNNMRRFNTFTSDSYDRLPPAIWDSTGKMVIYGVLNTAEMGGNTIDGFAIPFNTTNIKSALLFVDTTNLQIVNVKPIYTKTTAGNTGIDPNSVTIDANGNYYAGYSTRVLFPKSSQSYQFDTLKHKSYVVAYDANGNTRWKKQLEGLQPLKMLAYAQELKVYGTNYIGSGFTNQAMNFSSNASPTTFDVQKLTIVTDSAAYAGSGRKGPGSLDNLVASLDASNGELQHLVHLGTSREEETGTMARGYGDQVFATSTIGLRVRNVNNFNDTASTLMTYKLPVATNCITNYRVMNMNGVFPVTLLSFTGELAGPVNRLTWVTSTEINNKGFELERSADGINFSSLGFISTKGQNGNSSIQLDYDFDDVRPLQGISYYRLRQVDRDGKFSYSNIVVLSRKLTAISLSGVYPNPATSRLNLVINSPRSEKITILVTDLAGKVLLNRPVTIIAGGNTSQIDITSFAAGTYLVKLLCANGCETATHKFIKQ